MAAKRLRWGQTNTSTFSDGRACLIVQFLDTEGNLCEWVPAWAQVQALFERACNIELINKPSSEWIAAFAKTSHTVFSGVSTQHEAYKVAGRLVRVKGGNLVFEVGEDPFGNVRFEELPAAFAMAEDFFKEWLGELATALAVNGYAIRLWRNKRMLVPKDPSSFSGFFGPQEMVERLVEIEYPPRKR